MVANFPIHQNLAGIHDHFHAFIVIISFHLAHSFGSSLHNKHLIARNTHRKNKPFAHGPRDGRRPTARFGVPALKWSSTLLSL